MTDEEMSKRGGAFSAVIAGCAGIIAALQGVSFFGVVGAFCTAFFIAAAISGVALRRMAARHSRHVEREAVLAPIPKLNAKPPPKTTQTHDLDVKITKAASLADEEAASASLYRYRREVLRVSEHQFDPDLAAEISAIEIKHFDDLISAYCESRVLCDAVAGGRADRALATAVDRLTARLGEIAEAQASRDLAGLEQNERFLRVRHPIQEDDPFR